MTYPPDVPFQHYIVGSTNTQALRRVTSVDVDSTFLVLFYGCFFLHLGTMHMDLSLSALVLTLRFTLVLTLRFTSVSFRFCAPLAVGFQVGGIFRGRDGRGGRRVRLGLHVQRRREDEHEVLQAWRQDGVASTTEKQQEGVVLEAETTRGHVFR